VTIGHSETRTCPRTNDDVTNGADEPAGMENGAAELSAGGRSGNVDAVAPKWEKAGVQGGRQVFLYVQPVVGAEVLC